jgi:hypothetical protein
LDWDILKKKKKKKKGIDQKKIASASYPLILHSYPLFLPQQRPDPARGEAQELPTQQPVEAAGVGID